MLPRQLLSADIKEVETQSILKNRRTFESQKVKNKKIVFADDTTGGSESELTSSESETETELPDKVNVPLKKEENEFANHVVGHLVKKVIRMKSQDGNESDTEVSDCEHEFLQSLNVGQKVECSNSQTPELTYGDDTDQYEITKPVDSGEGGNHYAETETEPPKTTVDSIEAKHDVENIESDTRTNSKEHQSSVDSKALMDIPFLGKLVRTQVRVFEYKFKVKLKFFNNI